MAAELPRDPDVEALLQQALPDTLNPPSPECVDAETLAAWSEHSLSTADAARVESHLATCARCQAVVAALAATDEAVVARAAVVPFQPRRAWKWIVPVSVAAAAALIWTIVPNRDVPVAQTQVARVESLPAVESAPPAAPARPVSPPARESAAKSAVRPEPQPSQKPAADATDRRQSAVQTNGLPTVTAPVPLPPPPAAPPPPRPEPAPLAAAMPPPPPPPAAPPLPPEQPPAAPVMRQGAESAGAAAASPSSDAIGELQVRASGFASVPTLEVRSREAVAGGAGRGGRGRAAQPGSVRDVSAPTETRWRVSNYTLVQRSFTGGRSWDVIRVDPPSRILAGSAPSPAVCWFAGDAGLILRTTDASEFVRVPFPNAATITSIAAASATAATVRTADGRTFATVDGGVTWSEEPR